MDSIRLSGGPETGKAGWTLAALWAVLVCAGAIGWWVQTGGGSISVTNVTYPNEQGIPVRAKLFRPEGATSEWPAPGVVFIHGYQSTRETGDPVCIELARRGFVALCIDALGRGNSGLPGADPKAPDFDDTFGGRASFAKLRSYPFVKPDKVGMIGHSLGAEMAYKVALRDPDVAALVIIGFAYTEDATAHVPKNMLMIIGQYDEFRDRMTQTRDIEAEWMAKPQTKKAIPVSSPELGKTYGSFEEGTARKVVVLPVIHIKETHDERAISEILKWVNEAIGPAQQVWIDTTDQTWPIKEWASLIAMLACFAALLPLGLLLLRTQLFADLRRPVFHVRACTPSEYLRYAGINGLTMWLYLPAAIIVFAIHKYVVRLDGVFPMIVVDVIAFWFLLINVIGFLLFRRWLRRRREDFRITPYDLGITHTPDGIAQDGIYIGKTALLGTILFTAAYGAQNLIESAFTVDFRYVFAFASDLTGYRWLMFLLYLPLFLAGFVQLGYFLHAQLRMPVKETWWGTYAHWTWHNALALMVPLILFLAIQYVPLFTTGAIPLVGPGGMFVLFMINLIHMLAVLTMIVPITTWFYQLTGRPYLGALVCAALVAWMFTSSQVIAPVPID